MQTRMESHWIEEQVKLSYMAGSTRRGVRMREVYPLLDPSNPKLFDELLPIDNQEHVELVAGSGGGKSEFEKLIYLRSVNKNDGSVVLIDPHGDLAKECAKLINEEDKKRLVYINPSLKDGRTPILNPLRIKTRNSKTINMAVDSIMGAFESIIGADFSPNMEALLVPCLYVLFTKGDANIDDVIRFMDDSNNQDLIDLGLKSPIESHRIWFEKRFKNKSLTRTKEAIFTKLQILVNNPIFSNLITGESTIDLEEKLNSNSIIIFDFSKKEMGKAVEPSALLMMAKIQSIAFQRAELPKDLRPKTYLICDEYQIYSGQISQSMLSQNRKHGLSIICAHQDLSQLDAKSRDTIMSNTRIKIVGYNSHKDLKAMSDELGIDVQLLKELKVGEFYVKIGVNEAFKIVTTDKYLDNKASVSDELWKKIRKYQIKHYYRKLNDDKIEVKTTSETKIDVPNKASMLPVPPSFDEEL